VVAFIIIDLALAVIYFLLRQSHKNKMKVIDLLPTTMNSNRTQAHSPLISKSYISQPKIVTTNLVAQSPGIVEQMPMSPKSPDSTDARKKKSEMVKNNLAANFKASMNGKDLRMHFEMDQLGYKLPTGKEVLKGVTGRIHDGKMTAIMGPSGTCMSMQLTSTRCW
jgi:ABC-type multidrug transport system fused ATPase/permease subunit